jgi:hypothetical protein
VAFSRALCSLIAQTLFLQVRMRFDSTLFVCSIVMLSLVLCDGIQPAHASSSSLFRSSILFHIFNRLFVRFTMSDDEVVDPKKLLAAKATENECKGALKAYKVCVLQII